MLTFKQFKKYYPLAYEKHYNMPILITNNSDYDILYLQYQKTKFTNTAFYKSPYLNWLNCLTLMEKLAGKQSSWPDYLS